MKDSHIASDADEIQRWARQIIERTTDPEIEQLARRIKSTADDIERAAR